MKKPKRRKAAASPDQPEPLQAPLNMALMDSLSYDGRPRRLRKHDKGSGTIVNLPRPEPGDARDLPTFEAPSATGSPIEQSALDRAFRDAVILFDELELNRE